MRYGLANSPDLFAIGPDIVFCGEFLGADNSQWRSHLQDFVDGDLHDLLTFIERFEHTPAIDRYVLINSFGDGRVLSAAPSVSKEPIGGYTLSCPVFSSAERISAAQLPTDFALSEDHDLMPTVDGGIAEVAGVDALPQKIKTGVRAEYV
jgi:hypothetical protein